MTPRYEMTYTVKPELMRRAMTSWAQPHKPVWRKLVWIAVMLAIGAAIGVLATRTGLLDQISGDLMLGVLIGFYLGLALWWFCHRRDVRRLSAFSDAQMQKQGPTTAVFSDAGTQMTSAIGTYTSEWGVYDQVIQMADATALRAGAMIYPIPYDALPEGVTPAQFHADLIAWQEAAA